MLQHDMKAYLGRLNANPYIPLSYRLKVLNSFERDLDLFDAEMMATILNAHKIGVQLVQEAARDQRSYYPVLVDMVSNALQLSTRVLLIELEYYRTPAAIAIRQSYDLMRLGLTVLPLLTPDAEESKSNLQRTIATHELLRVVDFFNKSAPAQQTTWRVLQRYTGLPKAHFVRRGENPDLHGEHFLMTNMNRPNVAGTLVPALPNPRLYDCIIIQLDALMEKLSADLRQAEALRQDPERQKRDLMTEKSLHDMLVGGKSLVNALRHRERHSNRRTSRGITVDIEQNLVHAFREAHASIGLDSYQFAGRAGDEKSDSWSVINLNAGGIGVERISEEEPKLAVGTLVGLTWSPHNGEPRLGEIKWIKIPRHGEQRMGIQFLKPGYSLHKAWLIGTKNTSNHPLHQTSLLLKSDRKRLIAILPSERILPRMVFRIQIRNEEAYFIVERIIRTGANYSICRLRKASREDASPQLSLA